MAKKGFWPDSKVAVIGGGSWGTVLAHLASLNCREVRVWVRDDEQARAINSTRTNPNYVPQLALNERVHSHSDIERVFAGGVQAVIWALPSSICRDRAREFAPLFRGDEILLHATKGVEHGTMKRVSEILREELPCPRIGVISGPNLAEEIAQKEPAATVIASRFEEVIQAGREVLGSERFRVYGIDDVVGVEWAGALKNILAIAAGALDALGFGTNARALLITRGLAEMVRFGVSLGAKESTFLGLAGVGDLLATCSSPLSRNYRVGAALAKGAKIEDVLKELGATAEGVRTARSVTAYAHAHKISMPITFAVNALIEEGASVQEALHALMTRPSHLE